MQKAIHVCEDQWGQDFKIIQIFDKFIWVTYTQEKIAACYSFLNLNLCLNFLFLNQGQVEDNVKIKKTLK